MEYLQSTTDGVVSYVMGRGLIPQLIITIVFFLALHIVLSLVEKIVQSIGDMNKQITILQKDTVNSTFSIPQNPLWSKQIFNSNNELNGMEYSYSMYIFLSPETFDATNAVTGGCANADATTTTTLKHIFHKGSKTVFPLMAPGVFVEGEKNTLRIYMNSSTNWNNYVSVPNIPVGKWFHLVIMMKGKFMDVYINGNVAARKQFATVPKLNVGTAYIMSGQRFPNRNNSGLQTDFIVGGPMKGMVSRVNYYAYALNYAQIDDLYRQGPSPVIVNPATTTANVPPYMRDDWWVTKY